MDNSIRDNVINKIIEIEGGYVDDPSDSGGATKYGVTVAVARANGFTGRMKDLPLDTAKSIYISKYWDSLNLDSIVEIAPDVAKEIVDTGVNMGISRAGKFFQRSLNVLNNRGVFYRDIAVDGAVGKKSILALGAFMYKRGSKGEAVLVKMLNCLQGAFYVNLAEKRQKDEKFIFGWFKHRVSL